MHQGGAEWGRNAHPWGDFGATAANQVLVHRIGAVARFLHASGRYPISATPRPFSGVLHMIAMKITLATLLAVTALPSLAQTAAPAAPEPEWSLTGNLGIFSDYRFRGISQTNKNPAIQGGVDFSMKNGLYLGNWNSNVDSAQYTLRRASEASIAFLK
jgi:hypothetical protein